jgi:preprotein translocase subunit SecG
MSWPQWLLSVVMICTCLFLMLVILLQRGRGGGIASAFGGGGGSGAFGAKTGDVFTWITCVMTGIFLILAIVANFAFDQSMAPTVDTPAVAAEAEPAPQLIPIQMGEDGVALPIEFGTIPPGQPEGAVPIITPTPAPEAAPPSPAGAQPVEPTAQPQTPPTADPQPADQPDQPPAQEPAEEPATP